MLFILWSLAILAALTLYFRQVYSKFHPYGVKHFTPLPLLGNMARMVFKMEHFTDDLQRTYSMFPGERFVGRYEFMYPIVAIRDIELIKKITVKDFEFFLNHRGLVDQQLDPLFGRNLFALKDQEWKDMRSTLSPAFTSSKMRHMLPFMIDVGEQMIKALKQKIAASGVDYVDVDCKDLTTRFANDVIASCAFGLKVDSLVEEDNQFYLMGKKSATFTFLQLLKFMGFSSFPKLMKFFKITFSDESSRKFFTNLVKGTMMDREQNNIIRPDMIHLLMEAKKGQLTHDESIQEVNAGFATVEESVVGKKKIDRVWSEVDLIAQAVLFFLAGFETVSAGMCFLLHELALSPDIQKRLLLEIQENEAKHGGKFDYNSVQNMVYMDMVVSEVLRLWPPAIALDRLCTKDYNLGKPNENAKHDFIIRKGSSVSILTWAIHRDPQYFPDPLKFDPERFSEENKHNIKPFTYMPFGLGPRNCIGSRFALCEMKVMAYQLLRHIEVSPCEKTCMTRELSTDSANIKLKGGHWLRIKARK